MSVEREHECKCEGRKHLHSRDTFKTLLSDIDRELFVYTLAILLFGIIGTLLTVYSFLATLGFVDPLISVVP